MLQSADRPRPSSAQLARRGRRALWRALAILGSASCLAIGVAAGPASAMLKGGTVGSPQPELKQFKVDKATGDGTGAVLADGTLVLAASVSNGDDIAVCVLHPGDRKCASTTTLKPQSGDEFFGTPEVLATGGEDVSVIANDCCNSTPDGIFMYNSSDDGAIWAPVVKAGTVSNVGAGTFAGGDIVVATTESGLQVQAFPPTATGPEGSFAVPSTKSDDDTSLANYNGGVLVAGDNLTNSYVEYAPSGSNFNATSSYKSVGTFKKELVTAVSGNALLTDPNGSLTGGERLRFFNGTSFGKSYKVPDTKQGDDGYFAMQEVGKVVHVFLIGRRDGYDLFSETTTNGKHWSKLQRYGTAIDASGLSPVLGPTGAGQVFEAPSANPTLCQPILNTQSVHITLKSSHVRHGHSTTLSGKASPHLSGQVVTLERESGKKWDTVKTTTESSSGTFSFTVPGTTQTYRAVVAYEPGYYQYGYSNSVKLTAT